MRKIGLSSIAVLLSIFILMAGCSKEDEENVETIQTYLENEFTGPSAELINAFEQEGAYPPELQAYVEENYKPLVADVEKFVMENLTMIHLRTAYEKGYALKPINFDIQKVDGTEENAYNFEVEVEYDKDGQTNTATVTGMMNMNDKGKISIIRNMDDGELLEKMNTR